MTTSWASYPSPWCWVLLFFDATIVSFLAVVSLVGISHIVTMWFLRKEFVMAVRSPILGIISGAAAVLDPCFLTVYKTISYDQPRGLETFVVFPVQAVFTAAYILRGCRLIVMYNPRYRHHRWAHLIIKESNSTKFLLGLFMAWQVLAWSAALKIGVEGVANTLPMTSLLDMLVTIIASATLLNKLTKARDLFHTSTEIVTVGGFAIIAFVMLVPRLAADKVVPVWFHHYFIFAVSTVRFHTALFITNIKPVRDLLRQKAVVTRDIGTENTKVPFFPFVPRTRGRGHRNGGKVAAGMLLEGRKTTKSTLETLETLESSNHSRAWMGPLQQIIDSPPRFAAFEEFCQRSLCSEAILFLKEVFEFCEAVQDKRTRKTQQFCHFTSVVNKFIKSDAPFEVNIDREAKKIIMRFLDKTRFTELDKVNRGRIFNLAVEQVGQMLTDNLLDRFFSTTQCKVIMGQPLSMIEEEDNNRRKHSIEANETMTPLGRFKAMMARSTWTTITSESC